MGCGCTWGRHPAFGDMVIDQCAEHAGAKRPVPLDEVALENRVRMMLDIELDRAVSRRRP